MKKAVKQIIYGITYLLVLPSGLLAKLSYLIFKTQRVFEFFSQLYSIIPGLPGVAWRACYYKQTLKQSYLDLDLAFGSYISKIEAEFAREVYIGGGTSLGYVKVGTRTIIANHVSILSGRNQHNFSDPDKLILNSDDIYKQIIIGEDTFVGDRSVVMANIGNKSIVGAGSVVIKDIPNGVIAAGNPANIIKIRKSETLKSNLVSHQKPARSNQ